MGLPAGADLAELDAPLPTFPQEARQARQVMVVDHRRRLEPEDLPAARQLPGEEGVAQKLVTVETARRLEGAPVDGHVGGRAHVDRMGRAAGKPLGKLAQVDRQVEGPTAVAVEGPHHHPAVGPVTRHQSGEPVGVGVDVRIEEDEEISRRPADPDVSGRMGQQAPRRADQGHTVEAGHLLGGLLVR